MAREQFILGPLDINDGADYSLESFTYNPARKKLQWVESEDGDGAALIEAAQYENATIEASIRMLGCTTLDEAFDKANLITDWLQEAERRAIAGHGLDSIWTPATSSRSVIVEVLAGENVARPIVVQGEEAGWFLENPQPLFRYRFDLFPVWRAATPVSIAAVSGSAPVVPIEIPDVGGDVHAEAEIVIEDTATKSRAHLEIGLEQLDAESPENLITNPGFEVDTTDWLGGLASATQNVFARSNDWSSQGEYSLHFKATATSGSAAAGLRSKSSTPASSYPVRPGWKYTYSLRINLISKGATAPRARIHWYTAAGAFISTSAGAAVTALGEQLASVTGDAPATAAFAILDFGNFLDLANGEVIEFYADCAQMFAPLLLDSDQLNVTGFAGSATTRTGAYNPDGSGNSVIRATLTTTPVTVAETPALPHVGSFRVKARVFASGTGPYSVRGVYRAGDAPLVPASGPGELTPLDDQWTEVDLGLVRLPDLDGLQSSKIRIEASSTTPGDTIDVDYLELIPATRYGKARAPFRATLPQAFLARDAANQTTGNLTGKSADVGGAYTAGGGDLDDFTVNATAHTITRTAAADSGASAGRRVYLATPTPAAVAAQVDVAWSTVLTGSNQVFSGLLLRWVDASNWLTVGIWAGDGVAFVGPYAYCAKMVAGVYTELITVFNERPAPSMAPDVWWTLQAAVDANGRVFFGYAPQGTQSIPLAPLAQDSVLATGGALDDGKIGLNDVKLAAGGITRSYDNLAAWVPEFDYVCHSGRTVTVRGDGRRDVCVRESVDGTIDDGRPPQYRGARFYIPPAGVKGRTTRILTKLRANDVDEFTDDDVDDSHSVLARITARGVGVPR